MEASVRGSGEDGLEAATSQPIASTPDTGSSSPRKEEVEEQHLASEQNSADDPEHEHSTAEREEALFAKEDLPRFGCEFDEVEHKLRFSQRWDERQQLLYDLRDNAIKTDPRVLLILKHVARNDDNVNLRLLAAEVLIHVGLQGIPEQIWLLSGPHWHTRLDALTTLERGAEANDEGVLAAFGTTLLDPSATVRARAIQVLIKLATERKKNLRAGEEVRGFPDFVMYRLLERLQDTDSKVRQTAIDGIVEISVEGESYIVEALAERMQSDSAPIRKAATEAMQRLSLKFDEVNSKKLREQDPESSPMVHVQRLLLHEDARVQRAALVALEGLSNATNSLYTASSGVLAANCDAVQARRPLNSQVPSATVDRRSIHASGSHPIVPLSLRRRGVTVQRTASAQGAGARSESTF